MHKYDPVIKDGKLARLSVSQLQRFLDCELKWYYKYIGGIDEPEREWFKVGKDEHKKLEEHYKGESNIFITSALAPPALELLPQPSNTTQPESELLHLSLAGIPFQGSIDLVDGDDIYDYKFQSRIQKFPEPSPQAWGYLEELRRRNVSGYNGGARLRFHYILISKKGANPVKQTFEFDTETIKQAWEAYAPTVERMKQVADGTKKAEANSEACYKYGPCPYLGICDRGAMSFLDKLKEAKKEEAAVELPEVRAEIQDGDEPSEEAKLKATLEAMVEDKPKRDPNKTLRPPEIADKPEPYEPFDSSDYERPKAKKAVAKLTITSTEVRHQVTFDIKRDGVFSASIGVGLTADCTTETRDEVRAQLSNMILEAIKKEAERYKKA